MLCVECLLTPTFCTWLRALEPDPYVLYQGDSLPSGFHWIWAMRSVRRRSKGKERMKLGTYSLSSLQPSTAGWLLPFVGPQSCGASPPCGALSLGTGNHSLTLPFRSRLVKKIPGRGFLVIFPEALHLPTFFFS